MFKCESIVSSKEENKLKLRDLEFLNLNSVKNNVFKDIENLSRTGDVNKFLRNDIYTKNQY